VARAIGTIGFLVLGWLALGGCRALVHFEDYAETAADADATTRARDADPEAPTPEAANPDDAPFDIGKSEAGLPTVIAVVSPADELHLVEGKAAVFTFAPSCVTGQAYVWGASGADAETGIGGGGGLVAVEWGLSNVPGYTALAGVRGTGATGGQPGGGGNGGPSNSVEAAGGGGGFSRIMSNDGTFVFVAGGGGGGCSTLQYTRVGGAGGGNANLNGTIGGGPLAGGGGLATTGGFAGTSDDLATAGEQWQGGVGATGPKAVGGGGGGGAFGGGGGGTQSDDCGGGGGGGGKIVPASLVKLSAPAQQFPPGGEVLVRCKP
jgi:hypothetical protein